jgi:hypothetical protein
VQIAERYSHKFVMLVSMGAVAPCNICITDGKEIILVFLNQDLQYGILWVAGCEQESAVGD